MKELVSFIGNQYLTASEQLTMHCKDKAKEILSFQALQPDTIYAVIDDNNEIKLKEENELLIKEIKELKKNSLDWHYMEKDPMDFPFTGVKVLVVYKTKCENYVWEPTFGIFTEKGEWKIQGFDNNYHFVVKWAYIPN